MHGAVGLGGLLVLRILEDLADDLLDPVEHAPERLWVLRMAGDVREAER
jgi:hypothetical protein